MSLLTHGLGIRYLSDGWHWKNDAQVFLMCKIKIIRRDMQNLLPHFYESTNHICTLSTDTSTKYELLYNHPRLIKLGSKFYTKVWVFGNCNWWIIWNGWGSFCHRCQYFCWFVSCKNFAWNIPGPLVLRIKYWSADALVRAKILLESFS